ncbi:MAG: efflux RND transporter periplasmic adaptor subunit [Fuerstiella sp.]
MRRIALLSTAGIISFAGSLLASGDESAPLNDMKHSNSGHQAGNSNSLAMAALPPIYTALLQQQPQQQQFDSAAYSMSNQLHGIAKPSNAVDLPSLVPGIISEMHAIEGKFVKKGDRLVTLDDRVPQARLKAATIEAQLTGALQRAEVELKLAENRLTRIQQVMRQGAGANFELIEAEGARDQAVAAVAQQKDVLKAAEANRELAEAQLNQYTITAPFDGLVTEIHVKSGAVDPSMVIVSMANLAILEVELHVPSHLFGRIGRGDKLALQASAPVSGVVQSTVVSVSPIINSASNTFRCLLNIDNSRGQLPAGFTVTLPENSGNGNNGRISLAP